MQGKTGWSEAAVEKSVGYIYEHGIINFDQINRDLNKCHNKAVWKNPTAYLRVLDGFNEAMGLIESEQRPVLQSKWTEHTTHCKISCRIDFYRKMLRSQEHYQSITLQRIESQRGAVGLHQP